MRENPIFDIFCLNFVCFWCWKIFMKIRWIFNVFEYQKGLRLVWSELLIWKFLRKFEFSYLRCFKNRKIFSLLNDSKVQIAKRFIRSISVIHSFLHILEAINISGLFCDSMKLIEMLKWILTLSGRLFILVSSIWLMKWLATLEPLTIGSDWVLIHNFQ
jgi:hypothetical protein